MSEQTKTPAVSGSAIVAAGLASAVAAAVTARFGAVGAIGGAALTTMIITGGSAVMKSYLDSLSSRVKSAPGNIRSRADQRRSEESASPGGNPQENPAGRMGAALNWFSSLSPERRRPILVKGLASAAVAFVIGVVLISGVELGIGNSLSCAIWANQGCVTTGVDIGNQSGGNPISITGGSGGSGGGVPVPGGGESPAGGGGGAPAQ